MNAIEKYDVLVNSMQVKLENRGLSKFRERYYLKLKENWGIIQFQLSRKSTKTIVQFTVNLGVASTRILRVFSPQRVQNPDVWDCHWRIRLGNLINQDTDFWWTIDDNTSIITLSQIILDNIVNYGLPEIGKYIDDESLRDLWMAGQSPSLTDGQRLKYLMTLIKEIGPKDKLEFVQSELKKVFSGENQ